MFNLVIHDHLLALGFVWIAHEADWYDDGDGESGPHMAGGPAWDEYEADDWRVIVSHLGRVEG